MTRIAKRLSDYINWSDTELIAEATALYGAIFISECFGSRDCLRFNMAAELLARRGYVFKKTRRGLIITRGR